MPTPRLVSTSLWVQNRNRTAAVPFAPASVRMDTCAQQRPRTCHEGLWVPIIAQPWQATQTERPNPERPLVKPCSDDSLPRHGRDCLIRRWHAQAINKLRYLPHPMGEGGKIGNNGVLSME